MSLMTPSLGNETDDPHNAEGWSPDLKMWTPSLRPSLTARILLAAILAHLEDLDAKSRVLPPGAK